MPVVGRRCHLGGCARRQQRRRVTQERDTITIECERETLEALGERLRALDIEVTTYNDLTAMRQNIELAIWNDALTTSADR